MIMIRTLVLALAAALCAGSASAEAKIPLARISAYLNSFVTAKAEFTQVNGDGTISTGTLFIKRPGRARFEYAPPNDALVIAGGSQVAIYDPKSNQPPEQYPLSRTPLNIILARNVALSNERMVVAHSSDGTTTSVVAQDPEHPEYGNIRLVFTDDPVQLRQWVITDNAGGETTVILGDMTTGVDLRSSLFNIVLETQERMRQ